MSRIARLVVPTFPHHITQRGNRRQQTFFSDDDYRMYIRLIADSCQLHGVEIWAYCLMPNHIHLIAAPKTKEALKLAIGRAHQRYTKEVNAQNKWHGYLWQGRFASFVMDESYLLAAARYIELNPVRAGLVNKPLNYRWSSAKAHITGKDDHLAKVSALIDLVDNWQQYLSEDVCQNNLDDLRRHQRTGRPLGSEKFINKLEMLTGRTLKKSKPGPKGN